MGHSVEYALSRANKALKKGNTEEAKLVFESILNVYPENLRAKKGIAKITSRPLQIAADLDLTSLREKYQSGQFQEGISEAENLLKQFHQNPNIWNLKGACHGKLSQFEEALNCFKQALALKADTASVHSNMGAIFIEINNFENAITHFSRALELDPNFFDAHRNLAIVYEKQKVLDKANKHFIHALKIRPDNIEVLMAYGSFLSGQNRREAAIEQFQKALLLEPKNIQIMNNLGNQYLALKNHQKAISQYETALEIDPDYSDALNNLANALKEIDFLDEAIFYYEKALKSPNARIELKSNLGVALKDRGRFDEAIKWFNEAIQEKPDYPDAYWNRSLSHIASGQLKQGWEGFEWRWRSTNFDSTYLPTSRLRWSGAKERVLVWPEQGLGDQIMFSTMFEEFSQLCELPIFQVDRRLLPIFRRSFPEFYFIPSDKTLAENEYDSHIPMGSLAQHLRNNIDSFSHFNNRKLLTQEGQSQRIRSAFRLGNKKLIGISWYSKNSDQGQRRTIPLEKFIQPFIGQDVAVVSLQYGDTEAEIKSVYENTGVPILTVNEIDTFADIDGLASLIECCDGIITIDNSTVHLAAAIGKPTHLLLPSQLDWRWFNNAFKNTWYDCLKIHATEHGYKITDTAEEYISLAIRDIVSQSKMQS